MAEIQEELEPPLPPHAGHARVGRRPLREGDRALRGPRPARHQHDLRPAGPRLPRPRQPRAGIRCGRCAPTSHLPVHFHIGSSNTAMDFYGNYFWESQDEYVKPAIGGSMLFINNARVVINTVFAGIFDRFPELQMVSVESGIGWVPFILETMDYELFENAPDAGGRADRSCRRSTSGSNWYATFWFEEQPGRRPGPARQGRRRPRAVRDRLPPPHLPVPVAARDRGREDEHPPAREQRAVMGENAARLYRV